jgi:hypothetical protein
MKKVWTILNRILVYGFFAMGVILFFYGTGRISTMLTAFGSFIASVIIAWILNFKKIDKKYMLYINFTLWANLLGEVAWYYHNVILYDKLIHLTAGLVLSSMIHDYYSNNSNLKKDSIFFTVMGLLAVWEIYEYILDSFFGFQSQGVVRNSMFTQLPLDDTMLDLVWGAIGSLSYLFFKKEKIDLAIKKDVEKTKELVKRDLTQVKHFIRERKIGREPHYFRRAMKSMWEFRI